MKQVVDLFKERKIPTVATARKIIHLLGPKNKKTNITGLERLEEYKTAETPTGRLTIHTKPTKNFIKGTINTITTYFHTKKGKGIEYGKTYHRAMPQTYEIEAKTTQEAEEQYKQLAHDDIEKKKGPEYKCMHIILEYIFVDDLTGAFSVRANNEMDSFIKSDISMNSFPVVTVY